MEHADPVQKLLLLLLLSDGNFRAAYNLMILTDMIFYMSSKALTKSYFDHLIAVSSSLKM